VTLRRALVFQPSGDGEVFARDLTSTSMNQSPAQQWSALSALYEQADGLAADALAVWLGQLETEQNPLLPQLKRMLAARAEVETNDFLGTLPKLHSADPQAGAHWAPGKQVGPYRLLRPLGEGGMAEVWLAERADGAIKRRVAIKLPFPRAGRETFAVRFDRERDILATLRHPNIAGLYDAGVTADGQAWLALEYVDGEPLSAWCDEQRLSLRDRVTLFRQVLLAVQHAHANLVIHRDLKPANILVTAQGEVRLLDFGIAKLLESQGDAMPETELTRQGGSPLTPRYASPEQLTGMPLTTACDVYSLGVVFYELLSGERPYELKAESAAQLEHAILEIEPRAPSRRALTELHAADCAGISVKALRKALAPELDAIVLRCLAKQPTARYASVDAVIADIDRWLNGEAVLARAPGAWYRFGKFAARHRLGVALGAGAVLSLIAVTAVAVVMGLQAREESARAVAARDFMLNIFKRADQEKSRGADITARDMLETGRKDVLTRLAGQPRLQAELLQGIGEIQRDMAEFAGAANTFGEVASLYAQLGMPRQNALALADRADAAMRMGDQTLAQEMLDKAKAVSTRQGSDPLLEERLSEVGGGVAYRLGKSAQAQELFGKARRDALVAFGPDHPKSAEPLRGLILVQRQLRRFDEALALQKELEQISSRAVTSDPRAVAELDAGRADLLYEAGRYKAGMADTTASLFRCEKALVPNDERCRRLRIAKMRFALRLGAIDQVEPDFQFMESLANDPSSPNIQADALVMLFRLHSAMGASQQQRDLFARVERLCVSDAKAGLDPNFKIVAMLALAEDRLRLGDSADAQRWIDQANALQSSTGLSVPPLLRAVSTLLSGLVKLLENQPEQAVVLLREAQHAVARARGDEHPLTRLVSLNVALALDAMGRTDEALEIATASEAPLREALGSDAPSFQRLGRLKLQLQSSHNQNQIVHRTSPQALRADAPRRPLVRDFFT
jgi:tetratricopeptide (TPR) repeat protein/tRNA A-37 threonylcarbamoyl transferase component Bud32